MEAARENDSRIAVRGLRPDDLPAVVGLDAKNVGRRREEYFRIKLRQNLAETGVKVSLAAEIDGCFCGYLLARVYYGEFGIPEPTAVLDSLGVNPDFQGRGVGHALLEQLRVNLHGLGVGRLTTEVAWDDMRLLGFFHHEGFRPSARLCLDVGIGPRPA